jgi:DNA topoisomerase-1
MKPSRSKSVSVDIKVGEAVFRATDTRVVEPGFTKVLKLLSAKEKSERLPHLSVGDVLEAIHYLPEQHFTSGPARYTDASVVKVLEEKGIGRPSTYAPIISVLLDRYYVVRKNKQLVPTPLGRIINDILIESFPDVLDVNFTAAMEKRLDNIEDEQEDWVSMISDFYGPFKDKVDHVMETLESVKAHWTRKRTSCARNAGDHGQEAGPVRVLPGCSVSRECMNTKSIRSATVRDRGAAARSSHGRSRGAGARNSTAVPTTRLRFHHPLQTDKHEMPKCGQFLVRRMTRRWVPSSLHQSRL